MATAREYAVWGTLLAGHILFFVSGILLSYIIHHLYHLSMICEGVNMIVGILALGHLIVASGLLTLDIQRFLLPYMARKSKGKTLKVQVNSNYEDDGEELLGLDDVHTKKTNSTKLVWIVVKIILILIFAAGWLMVIFNFVLYDLYKTQQLAGQQLPNTVFKGLSNPVTINMESDEVIHIEGSSMHDVAFAQGVMVAQKRLWQLEFQRRVGSGTLSAIVGSGGLATDKLMRTLGLYRAANASFGVLSKKSQDLLTSYTAGINAFLKESVVWPLEFHLLKVTPKTFTTTDSLVWAKIMSLDLSGNMAIELDRFRLVVDQGLTINRAMELYPPFEMGSIAERPAFPTVLQPEDICHPNTTNATYAANCNNTRASEWLKPLQNKTSLLPKTNETGPVRVKKMFQNFDGIGLKGASNNWVVHGSRTKSGKPLLCNDPHLQLMAPSIWILFHLHVTSATEPYNCIGASFVGLPGIVIGHNSNISWGVTNTGVDVQDLYIINQTDDGKMYHDGDNLKKFDTRDEVIEVAHGKAERIVVRSVDGIGPIITDYNLQAPYKYGNVPLALRWVSIDPSIPDTTFETFLSLNTAESITEAQQALKTLVAPAQNFIFADTHGNIGYQMPGIIPIREPGHTGMFPVPLYTAGNKSRRFQWQGFHPFSDLPSVLNPKQGFIATANNRVTPDCYPKHITCDWDEGSDGFRAMRITDMINASKEHTVDTMKDIQLDYHTYLYRELLPIFTHSCRIRENKVSKMCHILQTWDGNTSIGSTGAYLFERWFMELSKLPINETNTTHWKNPIFLRREASKCVDDPANNKNICDFLDKSLEIVANETHFGKIPQWGVDLHQATFVHQILNSSIAKCIGDRSVAHGGDEFTVNVGHFDFDDPNLGQTAGPSYRQIVDLSNLENSLFLNPLGQDGDQLNVHYDDLLAAWSQGEYLAMKTKAYPIASSTHLKK
eukprot:m.55528 g.55528  ORF g.55528 m.55528 type:complete len:949 (-) comp10988_c0_seq2:129-2975(-)